MKGLVVIPFVDCAEETTQATRDALAQLDHTADVLLIDNGSGNLARTDAETMAQTSAGRIRLWQHRPPMPSLAATWNRALDYAWEAGHADCFVWNNDTRVAPHMYEALRLVAKRQGLWFTTPVNCASQTDPDIWKVPMYPQGGMGLPIVDLGGPDFSCYLITRECHAKYRFDERFQPAYHEDGDFHRRLWLGGDGDKIAGVTLPYLHYGSRTIHRSEAAYAAFQPQFAACRARYVAKWGGEPHHETRTIPDTTGSFGELVATPGGYLGPEKPPPCLQCGSFGFELRWGTRASGETFAGCAFCSGHLNSEPDGGPRTVEPDGRD